MNDDITVTLTYSPSEAEQVVRALRYFNINVSALGEDHDRLLLIESAIHRALPRPRPAEPQGLGAVVEDSDGKRFVRYTDELTAPWRHVEPPCGARPYRYYADIDAVKVLSEGVPA